MPTYGLMPPPLAFVIQELDIARAAAADGKIDLEYDCRIRGSVFEGIPIPLRSDRIVATQGTLAPGTWTWSQDIISII